MDGLMAGNSLYASSVVLPAGVILISDPHMPVIHLSERSTVVEEVPVVAAEGAATAEGAAAPAADAAKE
jgi:large subunit ribosomal protein L25